MRRSDKRRAQAHLNEAVKHLAAARVVVQHLERDAELSHGERADLGDITSVVRSLAGEVDASLRGRVWDLELTDLFIMPTEEGRDPA